MINNDKTPDRRNFIKKCLNLAGLGFAIPSVIALNNSCEQNENIFYPGGKEFLKIKEFPILEDVGGAIIKNFANIAEPAMIIRYSEKEFMVANTKCTHRGCIVELPRSKTSDIECQCHFAIFSRVDASVISNPHGPNISPLTRYKNVYNAGIQELEINFSEII